MKVKVIAVDEQDRVKLSRKAAMREMASSRSGNGAAVTSGDVRLSTIVGQRVPHRGQHWLRLYRRDRYGDSATESGIRRRTTPPPRSSG